MYNKLLSMVFIATLLFGVYLVLASKTWFSAWLGLEMNLLSFLPLILLSADNTMESGLKYFLIQAAASLVILQASFTWFLAPSYALLILTPISLKLGLAPFHFWLPAISKNLNWTQNTILLTIQKIGPVFLLATAGATNKMFLAFVGTSSMAVGAIGGLNEMDMRKLMAFSSISHMGWVSVSALMAPSLWAMYLTAYIFMSATLMMMFNKTDIKYLSQLKPKDKYSPAAMILLLSLGGLPPLLGFAPKWAVLLKVTEVSLGLATFMIFTSVLTLYYYIRAGLATLALSSASPPARPSGPHGPLAALLCSSALGGGLYMLVWSSLML